MRGGYAGKVLYVDLATQKIREEGLPKEEVLRAYIGCWGLAARTLYDVLPPGVSAKDPENPMIFWNGPLTASGVPGDNNFSHATKNFNTGFTAGRGHTHGELGKNMKKAGYDGLIITGCSEEPMYLLISDEGAELRDGRSLWGKDTHETEEILKGELGESVSVGAIGPVGENMCAGGMICNDRNHSMAHSGVGSVMGSKKLKAIVTRGSKSFPIASREKLSEIKKKWVHVLMQGPRYQRAHMGLMFKGEFRERAARGGFAGQNFRINQFNEFAVGLSKHKITAKPCRGCPHGCCVDIELVSGPHKGWVASMSGGGEGPEGAGAVLGIANPEHWVYLLDLYDRYGVEASVFGCTLAMAMEAYEKGILTSKDTDGLELKWGDPEVVETMLGKYARKEGFGAVLALGPLGAARAIGGDATKFAVHIKGSGMNLHDWRVGWGMMLSHIVSGGSGWPATAADAIGAEPDAGYPKATDPFDFKTKALEVRNTGKLKYMRDTIGTCGFMTWNVGGSTEVVAEAINAVTDWDFTVDELVKVGERVMNLERAFNVRQGLTPEDDYRASPRLLETCQDGKAAGRSLKPYIQGMVEDYYAVMGWDKKSGKPWRRTLEQLGLGDVAKDLWK
jgi:aldehyde:ferredoxin oxidoreductase